MFPFKTHDGRYITTVSDEQKWLESLIENDSNIRKDMARIFQVANRRIQNIEASMAAGRIGYSPAYDAVISYTGDAGGHFSKFHMVQNWDMMVEQTAQALAFLNEPTSTASGARSWQREITKGLTTRSGRQFTESDISRFMRAVFTHDYDYDEQFKSVAERYIISRTEMQVQSSKQSMDDFINSYVQAIEAEKIATARREAARVDAATSFIKAAFEGKNLGSMFTPIK